VAGKHEVAVLGLDIGCFGELLVGLVTIVHSRAVSYVDRHNDKSRSPWLVLLKDPSRVGSCGLFSWSDLILDRSRKLFGLQLPAASATRAGGDSGPNSENFGLFHAQSPDTGRGIHARSWRANRDMNARLCSLK